MGWGWRRALVALVICGGCSKLIGIEGLGSTDAGAADAAAVDASGDANGDAASLIDGAGTLDARPDAAPDAATCAVGAYQCNGDERQQCMSGAWTAVEQCVNYCSAGSCVAPPSCNGGVNTCGPTATTTCCAASPVPTGTFARSYDGVNAAYSDNRFQATLSGFELDDYEVSVARFQAFVAAYPGSQPSMGDGKNPHDATDPGWKSSWTALLPPSKQALSDGLLCGGLTAQGPSDPVRCVTWYTAQAFCIWDGGRLPTEAEWNFAASGGDQQRVYPWSQPASSTTVSATNAVYSTTAPARPGAHSPAGDGRWGHADLAGNVWEWTFDNFADPYPTQSCADCANHAAAATRSTRGGSFAVNSVTLFAALRGDLDPAIPDKTVGFRCAHDPTP
jgi:formylglycine-generating enzyme required for sulfatase activity